ncbi:MAG: type VII toxin-antitoxin system MntA family adenylyltransferase antitoxin [Steroidobacteraceae bacterium]
MTDAERETLLALAGRELAAALPRAWAVYAYGSFARGDEWPESDIDLAVLMPPGEPLPDRLGLISRIAQPIGRDVDLADLRRAGLDLAMEVIKDGRPLWVRQRDATLQWEVQQMSDYADFQPRRAAIVSAYLDEPLRERR